MITYTLVQLCEGTVTVHPLLHHGAYCQDLWYHSPDHHKLMDCGIFYTIEVLVLLPISSQCLFYMKNCTDKWKVMIR